MINTLITKIISAPLKDWYMTIVEDWIWVKNIINE